MKPSTWNRTALAQLAAANPVPLSHRESLNARLRQIKPKLPQRDEHTRRRRWKPSVLVLAVLFVLGVGGVAVAGSWNPLSAIGAADRPAEPADTPSADLVAQLRAFEQRSPGWVSAIGDLLDGQARLLGQLPNGEKVYAVPTSKGKLCLVSERSGACSAPSLLSVRSRSRPRRSGQGRLTSSGAQPPTVSSRSRSGSLGKL